MARELGPVMSGTVLGQRTLGLRLPDLTKYTRKLTNVCGKVGDPGYACQTQLDLVDAEKARELGLPEDTRAVVHKCVRKNSTEGEYVPVKTEKEALQVAKDFCGCVETQMETTRAKCARKR